MKVPPLTSAFDLKPSPFPKGHRRCKALSRRTDSEKGFIIEDAIAKAQYTMSILVHVQYMGKGICYRRMVYYDVMSRRSEWFYFRALATSFTELRSRSRASICHRGSLGSRSSFERIWSSRDSFSPSTKRVAAAERLGREEGDMVNRVSNADAGSRWPD